MSPKSIKKQNINVFYFLGLTFQKYLQVLAVITQWGKEVVSVDVANLEQKKNQNQT